MQPAVAVDRLGGPLRVVAVARGQERRPDQQLAVVGEPGLEPGHRYPTVPTVAVGRVERAAAGDLRHPPQLAQAIPRPRKNTGVSGAIGPRPGPGPPHLVEPDRGARLAQHVRLGGRVLGGQVVGDGGPGELGPGHLLADLDGPLRAARRPGSSSAASLASSAALSFSQTRGTANQIVGRVSASAAPIAFASAT